jgi:hypothetical protein
MNWEAVGAVAELLGAIGVIVSLLYLATQIRQNTRSVRMASQHDLMSEFRANVRALTQDPELGELFRNGLQDPEELSEADRARFGTQVASAVQIYEELYSHYRAGLVERDFWESRKQNLFYYMSLPGVSAWWRGEAILLPGRRGSDMVSEEFRQLVEESIAADGSAASPKGKAAADSGDGVQS